MAEKVLDPLRGYDRGSLRGDFLDTFVRFVCLNCMPYCLASVGAAGASSLICMPYMPYMPFCMSEVYACTALRLSGQQAPRRLYVFLICILILLVKLLNIFKIYFLFVSYA